MSGRFITLEGGEGAGKSTQLRALAAALAARGIDVVTTREPGGSPGAEAIRSLLMEGSDDRWDARSEALLFAAARADHVARTIRPALARGAWVLCDRFVDSSRAYQGGGGGLTDADILALHAFGSEGLLPDRTFLLTLGGGEAAKRLSVRDAAGADRMGSKPADYQARLAARFAELAAAEPDRWRVIDAGGAPDAVTSRLMEHLEPWL
ncbi:MULTISPECIES: dTMP kinase [unclassified Sphingopyxis]|uniref:dTMP kinase n=1 Tax=unclassified Sphingopyxis TaxID=2614943 RepID=UPI00073782AC|nr:MULTISPECIES: dTMP kinase [unclassified Sphingopyxis]KTE30480.1 thymidylate kinase [Sphingopyxis sp. HIX]KTE79261.1 thymidylate kinase [Sphingopyxis sp. HXXIV]